MRKSCAPSRRFNKSETLNGSPTATSTPTQPLHHLENTEVNADKRTFSVVYGKQTKKKHKTWEGDGTLEVGLKSAVLKDSEGKTIGVSTNVKTNELCEGSRVFIGSKEVEIIDLLSGAKCVQTGKRELDKEEGPVRCSKKKKVAPPQKIILTTTKPRGYEPLSLPKPNAEHQWHYNERHSPVVDVLVDGYLCQVLRPHQRDGLVFLYKCVTGMKSVGYTGAILADEMGLGKTLQCISLVWTLLRQGPYGSPLLKRALIVAPSSLVQNWNNEFKRWLGSHRITTFTVDKKNKPSDYLKVSYVPILIVSYEMFVRYNSDMAKIDFDMIICDEGHRLKNSNIRAASKKLYSIAVDFWNSAREEQEKVEHLSIINVLKKISNHPQLTSTNSKTTSTDDLVSQLNDLLPSGFDPDVSGKFLVVKNILRNLSGANEKIILVSNFTQTLDLFDDFCAKNDFKYLRFDGSTPTQNRSDIVSKFNSSSSAYRVLLLSSKAGGVGLNLIGASRLILFDSDWNPATDLQAMARIWREGQKKNVHIYRLLTSGTIDEKIFQRQLNKAGLSESVVDTNCASFLKLSNEELKDLFTFNPEDKCLTHDILRCSCSGDGSIPQLCPEIEEIENEIEIDLNPVASTALRMNQLLRWEHHSGPVDSTLLHDLLLSDVSDLVNYVFVNRTS